MISFYSPSLLSKLLAPAVLITGTLLTASWAGNSAAWAAAMVLVLLLVAGAWHAFGTVLEWSHADRTLTVRVRLMGRRLPGGAKYSYQEVHSIACPRDEHGLASLRVRLLDGSVYSILGGRMEADFAALVDAVFGPMDLSRNQRLGATATEAMPFRGNLGNG